MHYKHQILKKMNIKIALLLATLGFSTLSQAQQIPAPPQSQSILILNATAHLGTGEVIENAAIGFKDGKITKEENNNILSFEQKYKSNPPYEVGNAFYNLLNQVGENKFVELIKNYDIFEHFKFNKNDINSKEIYLDFLKNPLGYMQKIQINKDRKNDKENVSELLNIIENSEKNNSVIKNEDSFRSSLGKLVNEACDDVILHEDGDDNLEKRKKEYKEKEV